LTYDRKAHQTILRKRFLAYRKGFPPAGSFPAIFPLPNTEYPLQSLILFSLEILQKKPEFPKTDISSVSDFA